MARPHRPRPKHPADVLARIIGYHLRDLREAAGERQADVAARARAHGLDWIATTVALTEKGHRRLSLDEVFVLPAVYGVSFEEVLPRQAIDLWLLDRPAEARDFRLAKWVGREAQIWMKEVGHQPDFPWDSPRREPLPEDIDLVAGGEAELDAADALKLHPHHIALRAWKCHQAGRWQHPSLTQERDRRMQEAEKQDAVLQDPKVTEQDRAKRRRALRGHLSRALLRDIQDPTIAGRTTRSRKRG